MVDPVTVVADTMGTAVALAMGTSSIGAGGADATGIVDGLKKVVSESFDSCTVMVGTLWELQCCVLFVVGG